MLFITKYLLIYAVLLCGNKGFYLNRFDVDKEGELKYDAEQKLIDVLFEESDHAYRPVLNATDSINVNISISIIQIMDLVEKNQTLITQLWIYEEWVDETLIWKTDEEYLGLDSIIVPSSFLWLPDIYIFNNANSGDDGFVHLNESRLMISNSGLVEWIIPLIVQSTCTVDVTYFPFDRQSCQIILGSWIYDENQLNISLKNLLVDLSLYSPNTELHLLEIHLQRTSLPGERPKIVIYLQIRRKPLYYAYTILSPTLVLCILNLFSFLLPCDNGDKVGIGLTVFLSLYVLQLAVAENIPESNSLPLIGVFLTLVMTLNAISLVCATVVINVKKKGDLVFCPRVPDSILSFCKNVLSCLTCTTFVTVHEYYGECSDEQMKDVQERDDKERCKMTSNLTDVTISQLPFCTTSSAALFNFDLNNESKRGRHEDGFCKKISRKMKIKNKTKERNGSNRDIRYEWYFVAEVLDKTLFLIFFFTMVTTVIISLVVVPLIHS